MQLTNFRSHVYDIAEIHEHHDNQVAYMNSNLNGYNKKNFDYIVIFCNLYACNLLHAKFYPKLLKNAASDSKPRKLLNFFSKII
ncbi:hypothetical protein BpHYR1_017631 [Brachionus plicatilis]|uniref:Uncharacterized protein n=1 Tax=Brachionus plicatilis TaxID=10195 RepID=A0A3M7SE82_BRAPC|nr:hypothetical protein BpHYR1_017631 [Brachionus plicatilis]